MKQLWISACSDLQRLSRCQLRRKDDRRSFALPRASAGGGLHSRSEWNEGNGGKMWQLLSYSRDFAGCFQEREVNHFKRHVYPHNVVWCFLKKPIFGWHYSHHVVWVKTPSLHVVPPNTPSSAQFGPCFWEKHPERSGRHEGGCHHGPPCQSRSKLRQSWSRPSQKGP